jgi:uncharacterized repeat protein (TIGR01451 family)
VVPPGDPASTDDLRGLFQNVVWWLLGEACTDATADLSLTTQTNPAPQVGLLLEYDIQVAAGAECDRTGVLVTNVLPAGVQFFSASSEHGTWNYDAGARVVSFYLGAVSRFANPQMSVQVMPVVAGTNFIDVAGVSLNSALPVGAYCVTNVTEVLPGPDLTPHLSIALAGPNQYTLQLMGVSNVRYEVDSSPDLKNWTAATNLLGPQWMMLSELSGAASPAGLFYRAGVAP